MASDAIVRTALNYERLRFQNLNAEIVKQLTDSVDPAANHEIAARTAATIGAPNAVATSFADNSSAMFALSAHKKPGDVFIWPDFIRAASLENSSSAERHRLRPAKFG